MALRPKSLSIFGYRSLTSRLAAEVPGSTVDVNLRRRSQVSLVKLLTFDENGLRSLLTRVERRLSEH